MCVKSLGMALGWGLAPRQHKICKSPTPGTDKVGKCPAVFRRWGGGGCWVQLELTDAYSLVETLSQSM